MFDMADIPRSQRGLPDPVEYAELAVATRTSLLLFGTFGTARSMLARRITDLIPVSPGYEHLRASFRSPHSSISPTAMIKEFELARGGVLYLDEIDDFKTSLSLREAIPRILAGHNPPLVIASVTHHPSSNLKRSELVKRIENAWFPFPLRIDVAIGLSDIRDHREGKEPDYSINKPRSTAAIRQRIAEYDPGACLVAHDLIEEGDIDGAWAMLRGQAVQGRRRTNNPDRQGETMPSSKAMRRYTGFHQKDPKKVATFAPSLVIPASATLIGDAVHVLYKSDKLNPSTGIDEGWINYIHEHDRGVKIYRCDGRARGNKAEVPAWLQRADDLVWLGQCNGFAYQDDDGVHEAKGTRPYPDLFCTPNGKALLVIQNKRTLLAMIWGGRLGVEPRGIVH